MKDPLLSNPVPSTIVEETPRQTSHPITVEVRVRLLALAVAEPGGGYSVIVPALPGCVTEGETIEEVQANIIEAAEGWLESQHEHRSGEALRLVRE